MPLARITPVSNVLSGSADHGDDPRDQSAPPSEPAPPPALNPDVVSRFHALIEEVTDELLRDTQQPDRQTCRADAIALLIATCEQVDAPSESEESPLMYLLLEERQKAAAVLGVAESSGHLPEFLRA